MSDYLTGLVQRYRSRGVLVDTNILLLFFVGAFDRTQIGRKRTNQYSHEDYDLLTQFLGQFKRMVTTPNILSEVNSFLGQMGGPARTKCFTDFGGRISLLTEKNFLTEEYVASAQAVRLEHFPTIGLTDSTILYLVKGKYLVLTDDLTLHSFLEHEGIDSLNFNHLRPIF